MVDDMIEDNDPLKTRRDDSAEAPAGMLYVPNVM
jgi:hypothetical protein